MLCPLPLPLFTNSPSILTSLLLNHLHTQRKRRIMMHHMETSKAGQVDEDFIDIELSPSHTIEFEFQMCSSSHGKEAKSASPADELFYKGKLLPLHNSIDSPTFQEEEEEGREEQCSNPLESCNISPSESCRASGELNPDEYFFQWSTEVSAFIGCGGGGGSGDTHLSKKPWCKKIKLIKQYSLTQKLKSSRAYLRSLFGKSAGGFGNNVEGGGRNVSKAKVVRIHQVSSFSMKDILAGEMDDQISFTCHRKSFTEAIRRHCTSKCYSSSTTTLSSNCSSSSSSFSMTSSNGFYEISLLKRGIRANSEAENSVEGAIAHCKKSQLKNDSSEPKIEANEVKSCLVSASIVAACGGDNGRPEISRIR